LVADYLPKDKPVHLLGVGQFDDIIDLVRYGIDTFDCVEPTRLARMGTIYESGQGLSQFFSRKCSGVPVCCRDPLNLDTCPANKLDINKNIYQNNLEPVDKNCQCWVCQNFSKAYLHHLFKQKEILGYTLATYHNLFIMERFMGLIRQAIEKNQL
jgi:queuine tRNA-ribosyltransferase